MVSLEEQVAALVANRNLNGWREFAQSLFQSSPIDSGVALVQTVLDALRGTSSSGDFAFASEAGRVFVSACAHRGAAWSSALADLRMAVADWCTAAGDEALAQEQWRAMLPCDDDARTLSLLTRILRSAARAGDFAGAETACLRGLAPYRLLAADADAMEVVNAFIASVAALLASRRRFAEAAQRLHELYGRTGDVSQLRRAVVFALLSDAGAARSRLLAALCKEDAADRLGELHDILRRAQHVQLLRSEDMRRFLPFVEAPGDAEAARQAFVQHNLQAVSRVYANIGFTSLGDLLGIAPDAAERLVARMVSERRLMARLDQITQTVTFAAPENTSVTPLDMWDGKIAVICEELSRAADCIVNRHNEFNEYLMLR